MGKLTDTNWNHGKPPEPTSMKDYKSNPDTDINPSELKPKGSGGIAIPEPTSLEEQIDEALENQDWCGGCEHPVCLENQKSTIRKISRLIKSEQTKLLDRLEKQLPKRNNMLFNPVTRKKYHYSIKGYNKAIDQVLSALESERKATLKRIEE